MEISLPPCLGTSQASQKACLQLPGGPTQSRSQSEAQCLLSICHMGREDGSPVCGGTGVQHSKGDSGAHKHLASGCLTQLQGGAPSPQPGELPPFPHLAAYCGPSVPRWRADPPKPSSLLFSSPPLLSHQLSAPLRGGGVK